MSEFKLSITRFLGVSVFLLSLSHWFPLGVHPLELLSAFAHFTLALSVFVTVVFGFYRSRVAFVFSCLAIGLSATLVLPHFTKSNSNHTSDFTIGQFNVYHRNPSPEHAILELFDADVDILTIQELNSSWSLSIDSILKKKYPFHIEKPWEECCYGIGLYSKFPIVDGTFFELEKTPAIRATINVDGNDVVVISFHTRPPAFPNVTEIRNIQMRSIAEASAQTNQPLIVMGDFNIVPWNTEFKSFLKQGKLKAIRNGFQATYPMDFGIPLIPIDHITYSVGLEPTSCETLTITGSDHKGILAGFKLE